MLSQEHKVSYWHSPYDSPLSWMTVPHLIDNWAIKKPNQEAFVVRMNGHSRETITFSDLKKKTEMIASGLLAQGLVPGDFVLISGISCLNWLLCDFACQSIGIHTIRCKMSSLTKEGLITIANRNQIKAIFYHPGEDDEFEKHLKKCIPDAFIHTKESMCADIQTLKSIINLKEKNVRLPVISVDALFATEPLQMSRITFLKSKVVPNDICTVFMTSGSTGFPKAIPWTHFAFLNMMKTIRYFKDNLQDGDRYFSDRSLSWVASLTPLPLVYGITTVYVHPLTSADNHDLDFSIKVIHEEKITCGMFFQYLMVDILQKIAQGKAKPFALRWAFTGAEVIQPKTVLAFKQFAENIAFCYASSECGVVASNLHHDDLADSCKYAGFVELGVQVKIVDEKGNVLPMGEIGEIVIRSYTAFNGYLQDESTGMHRDIEGWIYTDDAGCLNDGYLKVFGRKSNVIYRGLTLIYPAAVEQLIRQFPGIEKVAVVGIPDKRLGQEVCAFVISNVNLTSGNMRSFFDETYKTDEGKGMTPKHFFFVDEFPIVNAKVDRKTLQKMAIERLGLD